MGVIDASNWTFKNELDIHIQLDLSVSGLRPNLAGRYMLQPDPS